MKRAAGRRCIGLLVAQVDNARGACLVGPHRPEEAQPLLKPTHAPIAEGRGLEHERTRRALERLPELCRELGMSASEIELAVEEVLQRR